MLLAGGTEEMTFKQTPSPTIHDDIVAILPNGQRCSPSFDTVASGFSSGYCHNCIGVSYASKKGRWIFRCGGRQPNAACKKNLDSS